MAESLTDPTRPLLNVSPVQETQGLLPRLSAIVIGRHTRYALIDGVVIRVGEQIGGLEVVAIESMRVKLRRNASLVELGLHPGVRKKKHGDR